MKRQVGEGCAILRPRDGLVILALQGEIDMGMERVLHAAIETAEDENPRILIVDLSDVGFMDSTGLKELIAAELRAREHGRTLILAGLHGLAHVLEATGLVDEFKIASDVREAISSYDTSSSMPMDGDGAIP